MASLASDSHMNEPNALQAESRPRVRFEYKARISTIIPAYNAERTIGQAIESALIQDIEDHEIVVVNDGSTDSTAAILTRYDGRIRVVNQKNRGLSAARNEGLALSSGEYVAFLDSDDAWLPGKLPIMTTALVREAGASLAFSGYGIIDEDNTEYRQSCFASPTTMMALMKERPFPFCFLGASIIPSTWVVRRSSLERSGGFSVAFRGAQGYEDCWMLLLLRDLGEFVYVPDKLTLYRVALTASFLRADKYIPGVRTFAKLVKRRYGHRGEAIVRRITTHHCRELLSKTAYQIDRGDQLGAMRSLLRIATLWPGFFVGPELRGRMLLPQNLTRVRKLASTLIRNTIGASDAK
jgi:glycosyltransferase involved in cell wall biosynthesis